MKPFALFLILFLSTTSISAQKNDFNWLFGYGGGSTSDSFGICILKFHNGNPEFSYFTDFKISLRGTNSIVSNDLGELRYYTNGDILHDNNHSKVPGGQNLSRVDSDNGIPLPQCALVITKPGHSEEYYLYYPYDTTYRIDSFGGGVSFLGLRFVEIYKDKFNNSKILFRDSMILRDTITEGGFTACKHANGRDWWMLIPEKAPSRGVHKLLITPEGPIYHSIQYMPHYIRHGVAESRFSPDGKYFAFKGEVGKETGSFLYVFTFDRCNGHLESILAENPYTTRLLNSICFSPNSRYLYWSHTDKLYQMDLQDPNFYQNRIMLDSIYPLYKFIAWSYLSNGPDGRMYSSTGGSNPLLHVIQKPNNKGLACVPQRSQIKLQTYNITLPHFPNYRLGPIDGSVCDSLGIDNVPWAWWRYDQDTVRYRCFEFVDLSGYLTEESEPEWYWDLGDGTQSRDTSPIHCFEKDGIYKVCLIVKNKYGADTLCRTLNVGTSATNDEGEIEITTDIFPNPALDHFVLNVHDYLPERMYLHLINPQGQTVHRERIYQDSNVIDTEQLPAGLYSVVIYERGAVVKTEKIVVRD
ncbi:MAG: T9SS type A sorting domain-containing protein [Saprospiraceae bacterium]|nr:T9SS type A sorting domain-containing protein [Saprospiraceae bacterium]